MLSSINHISKTLSFGTVNVACDLYYDNKYKNNENRFYEKYNALTKLTKKNPHKYSISKKVYTRGGQGFLEHQFNFSINSQKDVLSCNRDSLKRLEDIKKEEKIALYLKKSLTKSLSGGNDIKIFLDPDTKRAKVSYENILKCH